jgi:putative transposase
MSMLTELDLSTGQVYVLREEDRNELYSFVKELADGSFRLAHTRTDKQVDIPAVEFANMRCDGRLARVQCVIAGSDRAAESDDINPAALLSPDEPGLNLREQAVRRAAARRLQQARALRFYAMRHDEDPTATRGSAGLGAFISREYPDAKRRGYEWKPCPSALYRALRDCGSPGERPLQAFLINRGKHDPCARWHAKTIELKIKMVNQYWSDRKVREIDAIATFYTAFGRESASRQEQGEAPLVRPTKEVLRLWIKAAERWETYRTRYGERAADRRFRGRARGIQATRPLQFVMFDHTRIDAWAVILDENGDAILVERPWLTVAIDVFSRMILAAVVTYEPPSLYSVMQCLKQVVRRKQSLIDEFGEHKGATDGWGRPSTIIVDNGWEFVGVSFQVCCEAAGINVIWAPVKTPEYKAYIERAFHTFNEHVWHRLGSGIPFKPHEMVQLGLDPQAEAVHTAEMLADRLWRAIVTIYHVERHSGIEKAPARAWRQGILRSGRLTVDDVTVLDQFLGKARRCLLTTEGIRIDGHRFHSPETTSRLLDSLLRCSKSRQQRKSKLVSGTIHVLVTADPGDCSFVHVWDSRHRRNERLPNWDRRYTERCSWRTAALIKEFAEKQNLTFHSDEEKYAARDAYRRSLPASMSELSYAEGRRLVRPFESERPRLIDGNLIVHAQLETNHTDSGSFDVPTVLPALNREDDRIPRKGPRRGGRKATLKAARTRARKEAERASAVSGGTKDGRPMTPPAPMQRIGLPRDATPGIQQASGSWEVPDSARLHSALAEDLD